MLNKIRTSVIASIFLSLFPQITLAAAPPRDLQGLVDIVFNIIRSLIPLVFSIAFLGFLWGAARFILNADDATKRTEGSKAMLYGVIALFVMISVWGLIGLLTGTFLGTSNPQDIFLPQLLQ